MLSKSIAFGVLRKQFWCFALSHLDLEVIVKGTRTFPAAA
jgi:hypothetical protein